MATATEGLVGDGEEDGEGGAGAGGVLGAAQADGALVVADDLFGDPEAEAGSGGGFGGEEGFEEALLGFGRHAAAVVGDEDADAGVAGLPVAGAAGAQGELAGAGELTLRTHRARNWKTDRTGVYVLVADNGCGMSPETQRGLFEPFFTTKPATGTGLGLWVSEEIVRNHKGSIRLRSSQAPGRTGTTFAVFFPVAD